MDYDPEYSYTLMNVNYIDEDGNQVSVEDSKHYVEISPSNHALYLNITNSTNAYNNDNYNYVTYKKSNVHQLWFNHNKENVLIDDLKNIMSQYVQSSKTKHRIYENG